MKSFFVKGILVCFSLSVFFGCSLAVDNSENAAPSEIIEYGGEKIKVGILTEQDVANGITKSISQNLHDSRNSKGGSPAGARFITVIFRDGAANAAGIMRMFTAAENMAGNKIIYWVSSYIKGGTDVLHLPVGSPVDAEKELMYWKNWWINNRGVNWASQCVLLIGKSVGAAMLYRSLYRAYYSKSPYIGLQNFFKVAVVLIDTHEPGKPGDSDDGGKWWDYVYFDSSMGRSGYRYNLKFWNKWAQYINVNRKAQSQLGIYNTYQRYDSKWRGYSFSGIYNGKYYSITNIKQNNVKHLEIDTRQPSMSLGRDMIYNAITQFLCAAKDASF